MKIVIAVVVVVVVVAVVGYAVVMVRANRRGGMG